MNGMFLFTLILISCFIPMIFIPYWTRRTESFGVSIPEELYSNQQLKGMRKQYVWFTSILSVLILAIFWLLDMYFQYDEKTLAIIMSIIIGLYIVGTFLIYLVFHQKMKTLKAESDWGHNKSQLVVIDTGFRNQKITYSNFWFMIAFAIALITMLITFRFYDQVPERIPMNYNFTGEVTNWVDKSYKSLLMMPMIQIYMTIMFLFINIVIGKAKQQISAENTNKSIQQNVTFRRRWSAFIIITGTALTLMLSMIQLSFIFPISERILFIVSLALTIGMMIWAIILSITTGQGGSRVKITSDKNGEIIDRDDDQHWKLGQFYFNKNDPALFLEKRFGVGWTNNWAHPLSWIIIVSIILVPIIITVVLT